MVGIGGGRATIEGARREKKEGENTYRGVKGDRERKEQARRKRVYV